jgi:hypothetical protein
MKMRMPLLILLCVLTALSVPSPAETTAPETAPRTVSFRLSSACACAQCSFDAHRELKKFEGVKKTTLSVKDRRLDVVFKEAGQPLSALAIAVGKLDLGKGSTLLWPVPNGADPGQAADALSHISGIAAVRADAKARVVHLSFRADASVTVSQLDNALEGATDDRS